MRKLSLALLAAFAAMSGAGAAQACNYLEMQLLQLQVGGIQPDERDRARMLRNRLIQDGCRRGTVEPQPQTRVVREPRRQPTVSRRSNSGSSSQASRTKERAARAEVTNRTSSFLRARDGNYRTVCVRSCDGYFFPISFATGRENFERDAFICAQRCPAAETKLFYHTAISESAEDMRAADGTRYTDLPTAFQHRVSYNPSCTCGSASGASQTLAALLEGGVEPQQGSEEAPPPPVWRPAPGLDPETYANLVGGFAPSRASGAPATLTVAGAAIRNVGPTDETTRLLTPIPTGRP